MFQAIRSQLDRIHQFKALRLHTGHSFDPLGLESLERRELYSATIAYDAVTDLLTITGEEASDTVKVEYSGTTPVTMGIKVTASNWSGSIASTFNLIAFPIKEIHFFGSWGNDFFQNATGVPTHAFGGYGNDRLYGGSAVDSLNGEDGDDTLVGGEGNDVLRGGSGMNKILGRAGDDLLEGSSSKDYLDGGTGNDEIHGYGAGDDIMGGTGNDKIFGGSGADIIAAGSGDDMVKGEAGEDNIRGDDGIDWLWGGEGWDSIQGGADRDVVYGDGGNDSIRGGTGNDSLYGGPGGDTLYGEQGADWLYGHDGDDGLFGGIGDIDHLNGGFGDDRLLVIASEDASADVTSEDAQISFRNISSANPNLSGFGRVSFGAGAWTDAEIEIVDVALGNLHRHVGNSRLLKTAGGENIEFQRVGPQLTVLPGGAQIGGWNSGTRIIFTDVSFTRALDAQITTYHELGHNWDDPGENPFAREFRAISRWDKSNDPGDRPSDAAGDEWFYNDVDANFARTYGKWTPAEDYATTWETYFAWAYHGTTDGNNLVMSKIQSVDRLFQSMRTA